MLKPSDCAKKLSYAELPDRLKESYRAPATPLTGTGPVLVAEEIRRDGDKLYIGIGNGR